MARKDMMFTIDAEGRDKGKIFKITEMPASRAERWAARALHGMIRSGAPIPENIADSGMRGIAVLGMKALSLMSFAECQILMDEMFGCVQIVPDRSQPAFVRTILEDDIEEVATRIRLRKEVLQLHVGFSLADGGLT